MSVVRRLTLGDVTVNFDSRRVPIKGIDRSAGDYPYYGASGVVDFVADYIFDGEFLLIAEDGENLRTRKTPIAFMASGKFWVNNHAHVVQANHLANTRYLCYALQRTDISGYISGSTQPKLTKKSLNAIELDMPGKGYQDAVVEILEVLDDKIAVNDRIAATVEQILSLKFQQLGVVGAESDELVPVSELIDFNPKESVPKVSPVPYIDMAALATDRARINSVGEREPKSGAKFRNGDTLLARITPCLENGKTGYVDSLPEGEVGIGSTEFIVMRSKAGIPKELSYFIARSDSFREHAIRNMEGTSGRQRVSAANVADYLVRFPEASSLEAFGEESKHSFQYIKALSKESQSLSELRDTLLPRLMSGEIRVKDAERIVEDVT